MSADYEFGLQAAIDHDYATAPRPFALRAETPADFYAWQSALRLEIMRLLGIAGRTPPPVRAERVRSTPREGYTEEKWALDVGEPGHTRAPLYILTPETPPPHKPILVMHGHNPSVQYILGNYPDAAEAEKMRAVDNNYAQALAQAGYLVFALEQRGFGERLTAQDEMLQFDWPISCRHLSFSYLMNGRTLMGERVWDAMCALSYIQGRADVIPGMIGCTGNSSGGTTALWLAALDERVSVVVPGCYFCSFQASILGVQHCECNYVPGVLALCEMGDLAALTAPRPWRAINGEHDPIYPIAATRQQFETVQRAYDLLGAGDRCSLAVHPGEHAYNHAHSQEWFARWMA